MHELICTDETFDPNFTIEYKLSIQVGLDGFSFSILDDIRKKFVVFQHFPYNFKNQSFLARKANEVIQKNDILQKTYKSVTILYVTPQCTITPKLPCFTNSPDELVKLNYNVAANNETGAFDVVPLGGTVFFSYPEKLKAFFLSIYPECTFTHQLEPVFNQVIKKIEGKVVQAYVTINNKYFNLIVTKGNRLLFFNSFNYQNGHDIIYFIIAAFKTLQLKSDEVHVHLNGQVAEHSDVHQLLKTHFRRVNFIGFNTDYHYSYTFESVPKHQFFSVINPIG